MKKVTFSPYQSVNYSQEESLEKSNEFLAFCRSRRSIRFFSDAPVAKQIIENIIDAANLAPSGANIQPWSFCAISNKELKSEIRKKAEQEEYENYHGRMSQEWLDDLAKFDTDWNKEFIDIAPWIIVIFRKPYGIVEGEKKKHYYVNESVGIACGFLLAAIHNAGLVSLTHTPSPMKFLEQALDRPANEKAFLLIPVGYPEKECKVPNLTKKTLQEVCTFYD